jgi:hypothetical protein
MNGELIPPRPEPKAMIMFPKPDQTFVFVIVGCVVFLSVLVGILIVVL